MTTIDVSQVTVNGHRLAVRRSGSGRPVLFLHGIPTSSLLWRHVQPLLARHADTIAVDLLGYGASDKPVEPAPDLPLQAGLLHRLLKEQDLSDVLVVGHDIGGGVAQLLALRDPARVTGLVLVDTIAYDSFPEPTIARLRDAGWDERIQEIDLAAGLRRGLAKGLGDEAAATPELAAMYAAPFEGPEGRAAYLRAARALRTEDLSEVMDEVERLSCPVLVVWGADDPFQPIRYGERLAGALPRATMRTLAGARHFVPEDHGAELARLIVEWARL